MTTTVRTTTTRSVQDPTRRHALAGGLFYLLTFASSIPAWILIRGSVNADLTLVPGHETQLLWAGLGDFTNALACVGSAVALYPVVKRQNQALALGFVTTRLLEAAIIMTGVCALLAVLTLQQQTSGATGAEAASATFVGQGLVAVRDWSFLFGPGFMATFNALMLGTLLYKARLVPRIIPTVGLIGAPLLLAANLATYFGHNEQTSTVTMLATLPVAFWELGVGFYLTVKGFKPSPVTAGLVLGAAYGAEGLAGRGEPLADVALLALGGVDEDEAEVGVVGVEGHRARGPVGVVVGVGEHADQGPVAGHPATVAAQPLGVKRPDHGCGSVGGDQREERVDAREEVTRPQRQGRRALREAPRRGQQQGEVRADRERGRQHLPLLGGQEGR